jgi:hypothetical protein
VADVTVNATAKARIDVSNRETAVSPGLPGGLAGH